jgi:hypothetical protein
MEIPGAHIVQRGVRSGLRLGLGGREFPVDEFGQFPALLSRCEYFGVPAGADVGYVPGDEAFDFQKLGAALEGEFAAAKFNPSDEIDFVVRGLDHLRGFPSGGVNLA